MTVRLDPAFLKRPIAHRGLHDRAKGVIENSRAAVDAAIAGGFGIEIDLQPASDGVPMVFHDPELDRLTHESGAVRDRTAQELGSIALAGSAPVDRIPTLAEVLDRVAGRVPLLIELKDQDGALGPDTHGFPAAVARVLDGYEGPVALMSFSPAIMAELRDLVPGIARGLVTEAFDAPDWPDLPEPRRQSLARLGDVPDLDLAFISHHHARLDMPEVEALAASGLPVLCWTVRSPEDAARARKRAANITFEGFDPDPGDPQDAPGTA